MSNEKSLLPLAAIFGVLALVWAGSVAWQTQVDQQEDVVDLEEETEEALTFERIEHDAFSLSVPVGTHESQTDSGRGSGYIYYTSKDDAYRGDPIYSVGFYSSVEFNTGEAYTFEEWVEMEDVTLTGETVEIDGLLFSKGINQFNVESYYFYDAGMILSGTGVIVLPVIAEDDELGQAIEDSLTFIRKEASLFDLHESLDGDWRDSEEFQAAVLEAVSKDELYVIDEMDWGTGPGVQLLSTQDAECVTRADQMCFLLQQEIASTDQPLLQVWSIRKDNRLVRLDTLWFDGAHRYVLYRELLGDAGVMLSDGYALDVDTQERTTIGSFISSDNGRSLEVDGNTLTFDVTSADVMDGLRDVSLSASAQGTELFSVAGQQELNGVPLLIPDFVGTFQHPGTMWFDIDQIGNEEGYVYIFEHEGYKNVGRNDLYAEPWNGVGSIIESQ